MRTIKTYPKGAPFYIASAYGNVAVCFAVVWRHIPKTRLGVLGKTAVQVLGLQIMFPGKPCNQT